MSPARLPLFLRLAAFGVAVAVLLWLSLAPVSDLPAVTFWDKAEHALAYFVLGGLGIALFPANTTRLAAFVFTLGVAIEILQAIGGAGRQGDWRDVVANTTGLLAALAVAALIRVALQRRSDLSSR